MDYLNGLNDAQLGAVQHTHGPALVDAGPGSGKTKTLASRIAYLLDSGVPSGQILAVSFTRKSSQELAHRAQSLTDKLVTVSTFHKWAITSLRDAGIKFSILSAESQESFFRNLYPDDHTRRKVMTIIDKAKSHCFGSPEEWARSSFAQNLSEERISLVTNGWRAYEEYCRKTGKVDFTDLLRLFEYKWREENGQGPLSTAARRVRHFMIDEFQDTNQLQLELVKLWAQNYEDKDWRVKGFSASLMVCGDADQAIYGFRGGEPQIFLDFPKMFEGSSTFFLGENYRSKKRIVQQSVAVISHNNNRNDKAIRPMRAGDGETRARVISSPEEEAELIGREVRAILDAKPGAEIAILARHNDVLGTFQAILKGSGISASISEDIGKSTEVRIAENLFRVALDSKDETAIEQSIPARLGSHLRKAFVVQKKHPELSLFDIIASDPKMRVWLATVREMSSLLDKDKWAEAAAAAFLFSGAFDVISRDSPGISIGDVLSILDSITRLDNPDLESVVRAIHSTGGSARVELATLHGSKGCEWEHVFLVGVNSSTFPGNDPDEMEEERRLFYVGLTRAKDSLFVTTKANDISPFIGEMLVNQLDWTH